MLSDNRLSCQSCNLSSLPLVITFLKGTPEREESEGEEGTNDFPNVSSLSKSQYYDELSINTIKAIFLQ